MWLEALERRMWAAICTLRLLIEDFQAFCWKLAAIWDPDAWQETAGDGHSPALGADAEDFDAMTDAHQTLRSPRRVYILEKKLAAGDLCDVHWATAGDEHFVVKQPRLVTRDADALLAKEFDFLQALSGGSDHYARYFPQPVESFVPKGGGPHCNVLAWEEGYFTAGEIAIRHPSGLDGRHLAWMFKRLLAALGHVHRQGWVHGAVLPPHLLFQAEIHGLHLADGIHAARIGEPLRFVPAAYRDWYPPECKQGATAACDIYLAAKSIVYLAGGDVLRNVIPDHVPRPLRSFWQACLLESPRMRPQDAWELHEEFDDLLGDVYGAPQYVKLNME